MYCPMTSLSALSGFFLRHGRRKIISSACLNSTATSTVYIHRDPNFSPIYKLPIVQGCAVVNKFKKINFVTLSYLWPLSFTTYVAEFFPDAELTVNLLYFGLVTTGFSFLLGQAVSRLIGVIYVSKDKTSIKISYIGFWGTRQDEIYSVKKIGPLVDCPKPFNNLYMRLKIEADDPYLISLKYGIILNSELFYEIFGRNHATEEH